MNNEERVLYEFFANISLFTKMSYFLDKCKIKRSNFSNYLKYQNTGAIEFDRLNLLYTTIVEEFSKNISL